MHEQQVAAKGAKSLSFALGITALFFVVELVGGILTSSLALLADSWHMLSDVLALVFALFAAWFAERPIDVKRTFGYHRTEILAAFLSGILLWVVVGFTFYEAFIRLRNPVEVQTLNMLTIASLGLVANVMSALALSKSKSKNLNVKAAFLHVLADMVGSVAAISAGVVMYFTGFYQADPVASIALGALIFYSSAKLVRESLNVLLEGVPYGIDIGAVEHGIMKLEGVEDVHDLHVWCMTPTKICALSCHVVVTDGIDRRKLLSDLIQMLKEDFGIDHTTVQIEGKGYPIADSEHTRRNSSG